MSSSSSDSYELVYFDGRGLAETIRLLFTIAGVNFTDTRIPGGTSAEWQALKPKTFFGKVPFLKVNGKDEIPQSRAIERLLAKRFHLYGSNDIEAALIDAVVDQINDIRNTFRAATTDEAKKKFFEQELGVHFSNLERLASVKETVPHIVGDVASWADVALFSFYDGLKNASTNPDYQTILNEVARHPNLLSVIQNVESNHKVAPYLAARKATPF